VSTQSPHADGTPFRIDFDFLDHRLRVSTADGRDEAFPLVDGLSVADFDRQLHERLGRLGLDLEIRETPFGIPIQTPFPDDRDLRVTARPSFSRRCSMKSDAFA
jgi:uncharacterized protein DUF5996